MFKLSLGDLSVITALLFVMPKKKPPMQRMDGLFEAHNCIDQLSTESR